MYSLKNYVEAVSEMLLEAEDEKEQKAIIDSWLKLLEKHHRLEEMSKFKRLIDEEIESRKNKVTVILSDEGEKKSWEEYLKDSGAEPEWKIDPSLVGGAKIVWKNYLVDSSVATQLEKIRRRFAN
jgi:F0F1-type ATP synthase delta subunit